MANRLGILVDLVEASGDVELFGARQAFRTSEIDLGDIERRGELVAEVIDSEGLQVELMRAK
jgi:hypothetical protein